MRRWPEDLFEFACSCVWFCKKAVDMCRGLPSGTGKPQNTGESVAVYCVHYRVRRKQAADLSVSRKWPSLRACVRRTCLMCHRVPWRLRLRRMWILSQTGMCGIYFHMRQILRRRKLRGIVIVGPYCTIMLMNRGWWVIYVQNHVSKPPIAAGGQKMWSRGVPGDAIWSHYSCMLSDHRIHGYDHIILLQQDLQQ